MGERGAGGSQSLGPYRRSSTGQGGRVEARRPRGEAAVVTGVRGITGLSWGRGPGVQGGGAGHEPDAEHLA